MGETQHSTSEPRRGRERKRKRTGGREGRGEGRKAGRCTRVHASPVQQEVGK